MAIKPVPRIGIDEVMEAAAGGVLRALDARKSVRGYDLAEVVRSGFSVDFILRCGGRIGPIELQNLGGAQAGE